MSTDGKFGTFAGVFTPSLLTILGVIMYLRLPWMVGQAGLWVALGVVLAAHVVSVATGLSVASIATDKKVGAGGPYYIISRSFGLPIGGSIGVALFFGLSFSVSLYIVGFSQSMLGALGIEATATAIRVCGSLTLIGITVITFISTSLAIKSQYVILALVGGSILVVVLGEHTTTTPHLSAAAESPSFAVLFGIFFPAVTGFMAGVNMSGDLRDPKGAIPKGTILAIAAGFVVYVGLVIYLALAVDPAALRDDPEVLQHTALWGPAVLAGVWGATLSSALGSILGAPRILQAMSSDRITPRVFARGYGPTSEPRAALLIAFAIAEAGILIAELDLIARVVSMVFLAMYGAINVTCAIESWASPDFRPKFRIPKMVSIVGAVASLLLMIQLDLLAMLGSFTLMLGLFVAIKRRQLTLESGDTWEGVWSTVVRAGLQQLDRKAGERRNWRPNVLLFDEVDHAKHASIREFATTLASGNGMVTDFALAPPRTDDDDPTSATAPTTTMTATMGVFDTRIETAHPLETVASVAQHFGFAGVRPNTLLLPWRQHVDEPADFLRALEAGSRRGLNLLLFEEPRTSTRGEPRRIDVWLARGSGNLALSVALTRFITRAADWEGAALQVLIVGEGGDDDELMRAKATRYLETSRVDGRVRVVRRPEGEQLYDLVCNESRIADLVLLGLPTDLSGGSVLADLDRVASLPGGVVFLRASAMFADVLHVAPRHGATVPAGDQPTVAAQTAAEALAALAMPQEPALAAVARAIADHRAAQLHRLHDRVAAAYGVYVALTTVARSAVERRAEALIAAAREASPTARRKLAGRATAAFITEAERELAALESETIAAQATLLGEAIGALIAPGAALPESVTPVALVLRPRAAFRADPDDPRSLRRWKRRRRWRWFYRRTVPQTIAIGALARRGHERVVAEEVTRVIGRFRTASHDLSVEVGRALATVEWKAHAELSRADVAKPEALVAQVEASRDEAIARLDGLAAHARERIAEHLVALDGAVVEQARWLSRALDRVDAPLAARNAARDQGDRGKLAELSGVAEAWREEQQLLLRRSHLAVRLARFRDRLTVASAHTLEDVVACLRGSGARACADLRAALAAGTPPEEVSKDLPQDVSPLVARFARTAAALTGDLPETETVLADEATAALVRGNAKLDRVTVPVRAAVQSIVEADLLARLGAEGLRFAEADARAWAVARDTALLVSAQPRDHDDEDDDADVGADPVTDALSRLDGQLAKLAEVEVALAQGVIDGLEAVATATAFDELATSLDKRGGRGPDRDRASYLGTLVRRGAAGVRDVAASVIYRRSAGVVFATMTRASRDRSAAQTIRTLAERSAIAPAVLAALPLYYRNLFVGQININESFFAGRDREVELGAAVASGARAGLRSVLITGPRGSGKTTLCQQIATASGAAVHWIAPPASGAATRVGLQAAMRAALGDRGTLAQMALRLPPGTLLAFDDLELWWERHARGMEAIDELLALISETGDRVGYLLTGGAAAMRLLGALRPLPRVVHTQLVCQPLMARTLERVVMARHASTGLKLKFGSRVSEKLGSWARARLFDAHFEHAGGNVGYALRSWITHVDAYAEEIVTIRRPAPLDWDAIDDLRPDLVALLVELVLHKAATIDKLVRITDRAPDDVADAVAELTSIGLAVQSRRRVVQINPFVHVPLLAWLSRRELV